jgi:hypothetical protein
MTRGSGRVRRIADLGLVVLFGAVISLPAARSFLGPPIPSVGAENRVLATRPKLQLKGSILRLFPTRFDEYYNDRFGFRDTLVRWLHVAQVQWLRVSSSPQVILGKSGWLYLNAIPAGNDDATRPFSPDQVRHWQALLEARRDWLAARGIRYLFVVAPDKQSIYPQYLPHGCLRRQGGGPRWSQLLAQLRAQPVVPVLDLHEPLRRAAARERLYHVSDSHWNDRGAHLAYCRIVETLSPWFPGMQPLPRSDFEEVPLKDMGGDCAMILNLHDRIAEEDLELAPRTPRRARPTDPTIRLPLPPVWPLVAMEQPDRRLPRAIMFRDSFGAGLIPFLSEHFQRIVYVWQDYPLFDCDLIERERPDIVIQEMVERKLAFPDLKGVELHFASSGDSLCRTRETWFRCLRKPE